jgi:hypothetical protein
MGKTEVYSWRVSSEVKDDLEHAARSERRSLGALLDQISREWLAARRQRGGDDEQVQRQLHAAAAKCFGAVRGSDRRRSERTRELVRDRLTRRNARERAD